MKLYAYKDIKHYGKDVISTEVLLSYEKLDGLSIGLLLGEIEIQEPKKTVVKEVPQKQIYERNVYQNNADFLITVPRNAKNLKCTYEVEE